MKISYTKNFLRQYSKLDEQIRQKVDERIVLWQRNPFTPVLRDHQLQGTYRKYRSISITGDVRVLYLPLSNEALFDAAGTHSQLYG